MDVNRKDEVLTVSSLTSLLDTRLKLILSDMLDSKLDEKLKLLRALEALTTDIAVLKNTANDHKTRIESGEKYDRKKHSSLRYTS